MPDVYIFDFDDTLLRSPRPSGRRPTSSWWRDPASLQKPYIGPDIAWAYTITPTYDRMIQASRLEDATIMVLTGRPPYMTEQVAEVLEWISAPTDMIMAVGSPIIDNKLEVIWKVFNQNEPVPYIEIWDDKADHLIAFRRAIKHWSPQTQVVTHHVT